MPEAISIKQVYDELRRIEEQMVTKKEFESLINTLEIVGNSETMQQITGSIEDIKRGRVKEVNSVKDLIE